MRSSKNRSRGKPNRNRSHNTGNNLNRVFDSSGPEGKVRGTPQQIIDKYTQLVSDSTLSNDRVAAENFQQHAEHYTRLLGEAQRSAEAKRLQSEQANRERQVREREEREARIARQEAASTAQPSAAQPSAAQPSAAQPSAAQPSDAPNDPGQMPQPSAEPKADVPVQTAPDNGDSGLVETPESKPKRRTPRARKPRLPKAESQAPKAAEAPVVAETPDEPKAAE